MIYNALTIKDNIITGVHTATKPIEQGHFERSPKYADDTVVSFESGEYTQGHSMDEYADGILRPIVDRIADGLAAVPDGFELIDGELIKRDVPVEDAPPKLVDMLTAANAEIAALKLKLTALEPTITKLTRDTEALKLRLPVVKEPIAPIGGKTL